MDFRFQNFIRCYHHFYPSSDPKEKEKAKMGSKEKSDFDLQLIISDQMYKSS